VAFVTLATTWNVVAGLLGVILICAGAFTKHVYMSGNINVLLATPVSLVLALLIPLAFRTVRRRRLVRLSVQLSLLIAVSAVVTLVMHFVPAYWQHNAAILAVAVPAHCAIAFGLTWIAAPGSRASRSAV
jgi:dolichyl-phosphate-mannose--protein O-mannosyl transferase